MSRTQKRHDPYALPWTTAHCIAAFLLGVALVAQEALAWWVALLIAAAVYGTLLAIALFDR